ncbi:sulfotransferase domain-containing protein [Altererythrobacter sp.]|nr:sulfotransferase domain-containing protein [Altererythrobacter sp.]
MTTSPSQSGQKTGQQIGPRARTIGELIDLFAALGPSPDQVAAYRPLDPQPGDVVISPFGKCGTTMLQQMFHQLRMAARSGSVQGPVRGDDDFDDISCVVPWIETSIALDAVDINAPQKAQPRGFKSHLHYEGLPPGMRYIVTLRDPKEAYMSMYHFFEGWFFEPGTVQPDEFMPMWHSGGPSQLDYATHLLSWWARRDEADTLVLSYRWVIANKREAIRQMADLCGLAADEAVIDMVERRTDRAFMVEHSDKFDDLLMRGLAHHKAGIPLASDSSKVRSEGDRRLPIPQLIADEIDALWAERIAPVTGHADFAALAADLAA